MEKKRITRILITAMLVLLGLTSAAGEAAAQQSATIQQSWLTHGDKVNGASGMTMHVKLRTVNLKGVTCMMEVLIFKPNGSLVDTNDRRYAGDVGELCYQQNFVPNYVDATYNDYSIFIPYTAMLLDPGKATYKCVARVYRGKTKLCSATERFDGTGPAVAQAHLLQPGWRNKQQASANGNKQQASVGGNVRAGQQSLGSFPAGQTRYYVSSDGKSPMALKFYYDKGYKCATWYNHKWTNGIKLNLFGTKNGMNDFGQYKDQPRFGQYYSVYYERVRIFLLSFMEYVLVSSDYSRVTLKGSYGYKCSYHAVSKQQYDRLFASAQKALRSTGSGGTSGGYVGGSTVAPRPNGKYIRQNRIDKEPCYACHGTGRCPGCNGTGDMGDSHNFHKEKVVMRCSSCSGSGQCLTCHGTGRVVKF